MTDEQSTLAHRRPPTNEQLREHNQTLWRRQIERRRRQHEQEAASHRCGNDLCDSGAEDEVQI